MTRRRREETPLTMGQGMVLGAIWSFASVGWIAGIALLLTWWDSGFVDALFWFGMVLMMGAGAFVFAFVMALLCELLNITTKRSRRDALNYFAWAILYNLVIGGISLLIAFQFGISPRESKRNTTFPSSQSR